MGNLHENMAINQKSPPWNNNQHDNSRKNRKCSSPLTSAAGSAPLRDGHARFFPEPSVFKNQQGGRVKSQNGFVHTKFTLVLEDVQRNTFLFRIREKMNDGVK
jgi:hypothetical protein